MRECVLHGCTICFNEAAQSSHPDYISYMYVTIGPLRHKGLMFKDIDSTSRYNETYKKNY